MNIISFIVMVSLLGWLDSPEDGRDIFVQCMGSLTIHTHTFIHIHIYSYIYTHIYTHIHTHLYTQKHTHTHTPDCLVGCKLILVQFQTLFLFSSLFVRKRVSTDYVYALQPKSICSKYKENIHLQVLFSLQGQGKGLEGITINCGAGFLRLV